MPSAARSYDTPALSQVHAARREMTIFILSDVSPALRRRRAQPCALCPRHAMLRRAAPAAAEGRPVQMTRRRLFCPTTPVIAAR